MTHLCRWFWSAIASGAKPECLECSPPAKHQKIRKVGVCLENRVVSQIDITKEIEGSNDRGEVIDLLTKLGPRFEVCPPSVNIVPAALHQKCLLVGARYIPAVSEVPPPELTMAENSPFWHNRALEVESRSLYNDGLKETPQAVEGSKGPKAPSARRTRKAPKRS